MTTIPEIIPDRKITYRSHPGYMARENAGQTRATIIGHDGCYGSRWFHGPMCFERFTSDEEPTITKDGQWRLVVWQTLKRMDRPAGWWRGTPGMSIGMTGYAPVPQSGDYLAQWTPHARRHLSRWKKSKWIIREITFDEYVEGYSRSDQDIILRSLFNSLLKLRITTHPGLVRIYGAAPSATARIEAGFVSTDVPETGESLHTFSFLCPAGRDVAAGTGLMDHWFAVAQARGVSWLDFGIFWRKGDPKSWKGFSRFKSQFGTRFLEYPTPLMRFVSGK